MSRRSSMAGGPKFVTVDTEAIAAAINKTRGGMSLREFAKQGGVLNFATLSRMENEGMPDLMTYIHVCDLTGHKFEDFIIRWKAVRA